ncbi:MAG TPA: adenylyl-sulfate kinase [Kiritimatiellia bacterium]|nr:adenylyl-sulfate kinase [Kiritimatiellia bacterium]
MSDPGRNLSNPVKPVARVEREKLLGIRGGVYWMTGLSGSGKSTISRGLEKALLDSGRIAYVLDGDEIRTGLSRDLNFSQEDREENIRRIAEVSRMFAECGVICITSFISPLRRYREMARDIIGPERFFEVYIDTDLDVCESRDPKGLYRKARAGEITEFTGIDSAYEPPLCPDIHIKTKAISPTEAINILLEHARAAGLIK